MIDSPIDPGASAAPVRAATPADTDELVRLRAIMLAELGGTDPGEGWWRRSCATLLRERLGSGFIAFVVDDPDVPGRLAACVVGIVEQRLPHAHNPTGRVGYVFNVSTDPHHRRQGHSRACMRTLLQWYADNDVTMIDLHASAVAEPLYTSLGFAHAGLAMRLVR